MRILPFLVGLALSCLCTTVFADVFTVTSNADAGPGTLREAISKAAANGKVIKDVINFNLPGADVSCRTICINTQLPDLSSNLVIDGSSQPGAAFGVSDARVIISVNFTDATSYLVFSIKELTDVEIYGLMMAGPANSQRTLFGILLAASDNITIGGPGRGNVIKNIIFGIFSQFFDVPDPEVLVSENIRICSNILGLNEDGETIDAKGGCNLSFKLVRNLTIGGPQTNEGNTISGRVDISEWQKINTEKLQFTNNLMGVNHNGSKPVANPNNTLNFLSTLRTKCAINNNVICFTEFTLAVNCFFEIKGNKIGTDITGTQVFGNPGRALRLGYCNGGGIIGGINPADRNIISGSYLNAIGVEPPEPNILNIASPNVELLGNIFRCNNSNYTYKLDVYKPGEHFVTIDRRNDNGVAGSADPGARVDLYYSAGDCPGCEPEQLFTSVTANLSGQWHYNGQLQNKAIVASSTINGITSEFTRLHFSSPLNDVIITGACNGINGSIKGFKTSEPATYTWYNENKQPVATGSDLTGMPPGKYHLVADNGYCKITSAAYEIVFVTNDVTAPQLNDVQVCDPGGTNISVLSPVPGGIYRLYETATSAEIIDEQAQGVFHVSVPADRSFFVSRVNGACESERTEVKATIGITDLYVASAISPNGDGVNDVWRLSGIENYAASQINIFNRDGKNVFSSMGYDVPFNGTCNGQALSSGTYYYMIQLSKTCKILRGTLTILR